MPLFSTTSLASSTPEVLQPAMAQYGSETRLDSRGHEYICAYTVKGASLRVSGAGAGKEARLEAPWHNHLRKLGTLREDQLCPVPHTRLVLNHTIQLYLCIPVYLSPMGTSVPTQVRWLHESIVSHLGHDPGEGLGGGVVDSGRERLRLRVIQERERRLLVQRPRLTVTERRGPGISHAKSAIPSRTHKAGARHALLHESRGLV